MTDSNDFPEEFNTDIYRNKYSDLSFFKDQQLVEHYKKFGINEGRTCSQIGSREDFIRLIDQNSGLLLEIGPMDKPILDHKRTNGRSLDHSTKDQLIDNCRNEESVDTEKIVDIDYVWNGESYSDLIPERFNSVISSHNVEHVPDLIHYFNNISGVLIENGLVFLFIPDKRYCFDHFLTETNLLEVIYAHQEKFIRPPMHSILEHEHYITHNDPVRHWKGDNGVIDPDILAHYYNTGYNQLLQRLTAYKNTYFDVHVWKFTPFNFRDICNYLYRNRIIDLEIVRLYPTVRNQPEFFCIMKKKKVPAN